MTRIVGIDLGTTNSLIAYMERAYRRPWAKRPHHGAIRRRND